MDLPGVESDRVVFEKDVQFVGEKEMQNLEFKFLNKMVSLTRKQWV